MTMETALSNEDSSAGQEAPLRCWKRREAEVAATLPTSRDWESCTCCSSFNTYTYVCGLCQPQFLSRLWHVLCFRKTGPERKDDYGSQINEMADLSLEVRWTFSLSLDKTVSSGICAFVCVFSEHLHDYLQPGSHLC